METNKTKTAVEYAYNPTSRQLCIYKNGRLAGGFLGPVAEQNFMKLIENENENISIMSDDLDKQRKIRIFHACLAKQGIMQHKESILSEYGVDSASDLTSEQLQELINRYDTRRANNKQVNDEIRKLRSELLTICGKMGMHTTNQGEWAVVNNFFIKYTGKLLNKLSLDELKNARKQFNKILDWYKQKQAEAARLAKLN